MTRQPGCKSLVLCAASLLAGLTGGCGCRYDPQYSATQLHWAAGLRDPSQIEKALQAGVPVDARDAQGSTPLMYAAEDGSMRNVKALIDAGADVNAQNRDGRTALMNAATARWMHAHGLIRPHEEVIASVRLLIEAGADPMLRNIEGATALHAAAAFGDPERIELLISAGAEIEAHDRHGMTPLMFAARYAWPPENIQTLLDRGVAVNAVDDDGRTALIWLARAGNQQEESMRALLRAGAEMEIKDQAGWTAVMHAARYANTRYPAKWLLEAGASAKPAQWTPLMVAVICEDQEEFNRLLSPDADLEARDVWGRTAIMWAARFIQLGGSDFITTLALAGNDVNAHDEEGLTALILATDQAWLREMAVLQGAGADVNAVDHKGMTPLMHAAQQRMTGEFRVDELLRGGALVDQTDGEGRTALMFAAANSYDERVVKLLLAAGADPNAVDGQGHSVLDHANEHEVYGRQSIVKQIEAAISESGRSARAE